MLSISYFDIYSSIATMSSCHSFYSNSSENEFQEKDNRHPKDHATAATGSRSFSGHSLHAVFSVPASCHIAKKHPLIILMIKYVSL